MDALEFLLDVKEHPEKLPKFTYEGLSPGAALNVRATQEEHPCMLCGGMNQLAYIAHTRIGDRWLDFCYNCGCEIIEANWGY